MTQTAHVNQDEEKARRIQPARMESAEDARKGTFALHLFAKLLDYSEALNVRQSPLGCPPVYDASYFPWAAKLEAGWKAIRSELEQVLKRREELPNFQDISPDMRKIQTDSNWKTFFLYGYGLVSKRNCESCPETARLLKVIPGMKTAFFSILSPGKHIPPHRGPYNGVLRYHLGLIVPEPKKRCRIRIADKFYYWDEGQSLIFDDMYNHEVWNDTNGLRAVLFVDFLRPVRFPASLLRNAIVEMATWTPFIKGAQDRHQAWEAKFYQESQTNEESIR